MEASETPAPPVDDNSCENKSKSIEVNTGPNPAAQSAISNENSLFNKKRKLSLPLNVSHSGNIANLLKVSFKPPSKRPRGRPPLHPPSPAIFLPAPLPVPLKSLVAIPQPPKFASLPPTSSLVASHGISLPITTPSIAKNDSTVVTALSSSSSASAPITSNPPAPSESKPKISIEKLTDNIISKLMMDGPMSMFEIMKEFPDVNKDNIQAVVDMLHILSIIVPLKSNRPIISDFSSGTVTGGSSIPTTLPNIYALTGFMKAIEPIKLHEIEKSILQKQQHVTEINQRITKLKEGLPMDQSIPLTDLAQSAKALMIEMFTANPTLIHDPLYRDFYGQLLHKYR